MPMRSKFAVHGVELGQGMTLQRDSILLNQDQRQGSVLYACLSSTLCIDACESAGLPWMNLAMVRMFEGLCRDDVDTSLRCTAACICPAKQKWLC